MSVADSDESTSNHAGRRLCLAPCICCGRGLGPNEGLDIDAISASKLIRKRISLDHHMETQHPDHPWTPIFMAMMRDINEKHKLAQVLDADPEVQLSGPPFNSPTAAPTSTVDAPCCAKVRKMMSVSDVKQMRLHAKIKATIRAEMVESWERICARLLLLNHHDDVTRNCVAAILKDASTICGPAES